MMDVLQVRNMHPGPLTLIHDSNGTKEEFKWGGKGSAAQDDVQEIPVYVAESANFRRIQSRKIVKILDAHSADDQLNESTRLWMKQQEDANSKILGGLDRHQDLDFIALKCIGPGERGSLCGIAVNVRSKSRDDNPPLCVIHTGFAENFSKVVKDDGDVLWKFSKN
jgi:hypothetical protein